MRLTLNIGCGERTFQEYPKEHHCINYDIRLLEKVNVLGDARCLPFSDETFDYILASDIIEHFPIAQTASILKEWTRVLKNKGKIEFRLPNLRAICKKYIKGEHDAHLTSWLLYGGQDHAGNFHYVGFDRESFKETIQQAGLYAEWYKEEDNNMIVGATKK